MKEDITENSGSDLVTRMATANELAENKEVVKEIFKYGKVPVTYLPTRSMLRRPANPGLLSFIQNATTEQEVTNLLLKGKTDYQNASTKTIKKWEKAATKRIAQLKT